MRRFIAWLKQLWHIDKQITAINENTIRVKCVKAELEQAQRHLKDEITKVYDRMYTREEVDFLIHNALEGSTVDLPAEQVQEGVANVRKILDDAEVNAAQRDDWQ